jgi:predicted dienelactone hydrolase
MRTAITFVAICTAAAFLTACQAKERGPAPTAEVGAGEAGRTAAAPATVTFTTSDGWKIYASYWEAGEGKPAAILLHILTSDRRSYDDLGAKLAAAGFNVLALDSRGHGDSTKQNGETKRYTEFDDAAYKSSLLDVAAAKDFLAEKGADTSKLVIVGASIGANTAWRPRRRWLNIAAAPRTSLRAKRTNTRPTRWVSCTRSTPAPCLKYSSTRATAPRSSPPSRPSKTSS